MAEPTSTSSPGIWRQLLAWLGRSRSRPAPPKVEPPAKPPEGINHAEAARQADYLSEWMRAP